MGTFLSALQLERERECLMFHFIGSNLDSNLGHDPILPMETDRHQIELD